MTLHYRYHHPFFLLEKTGGHLFIIFCVHQVDQIIGLKVKDEEAFINLISGEVECDYNNTAVKSGDILIKRNKSMSISTLHPKCEGVSLSSSHKVL